MRITGLEIFTVAATIAGPVPTTPVGGIAVLILRTLGVALIVVPLIIVSVEIARVRKQCGRICVQCHSQVHEEDARFCNMCGVRLD